MNPNCVRDVLKGLKRINARLNATSGEIELIRARLVEDSTRLDYLRKYPLDYMIEQISNQTFNFHAIYRAIKATQSRGDIVESAAGFSDIARKVENLRGELMAAIYECRLVSRKG